MQCRAVVYRRDTYRYTGRVKGGFEMHYARGQCKRQAVDGGKFCTQHQRMRDRDGEQYVTEVRWS